MKIFAVMLAVIMFLLQPAAASPATPIFSAATGQEGLHPDFFPDDLQIANWMFQGMPTKYPLPRIIIGSGSRFSIAHATFRNGARFADTKTVMASIYTKVAENWGVTVGYENGQSRFGGLNFGAFYNISPNAAISIISTLNTNYTLLKNTAIAAQLIIRF